jgi:hypothetical protein
VDEGNKSLYWITSYFDRENFNDCTKYLNQAKDKAKELAGFPDDPLVKVRRYKEFTMNNPTGRKLSSLQ